MLTFGEDQSSSDLIVHYTAQTARDYSIMSKKLYTHTEYRTEWDKKAYDWIYRGYCKNVTEEEFRGEKDCIFRITFHKVKLCKEFLIEVNAYFSEFPEKAYCTKYMNIETLIDN